MCHGRYSITEWIVKSQGFRQENLMGEYFQVVNKMLTTALENLLVPSDLDSRINCRSLFGYHVQAEVVETAFGEVIGNLCFWRAKYVS